MPQGASLHRDRRLWPTHSTYRAKMLLAAKEYVATTTPTTTTIPIIGQIANIVRVHLSCGRRRFSRDAGNDRVVPDLLASAVS